MSTDRFGLPISASGSSLASYDRAVHGLLGWDGATLSLFETAAAADPRLALAHAGIAVCLFLEERFAEAQAAAERARAAAQDQTPRERSHVEALWLFVGGRAPEAERAMREHLATWPRDLVVLQRLYYLWFWQGRFPEMLALTERHVRDDDDPFLLGLHAFALEEGGRFAEGVRAAERAIARNPRDAWAVHALAHALYDMGASAEGITRLPAAVHPCRHLGWFRNHLLWHLALMHLSEGDHARGSAIVSAAFERAPSAVPGELHDSIGFLWRLELIGHPPGDRWRPFAEVARGRLQRHGLLYHAVHIAMALAASGDWAAAETHAGIMREKARKDDTGLTGDVALPLIDGMQAFVRADYRRTIDRIEPIRARIVELGGSRAQRDVYHDTLLEACFRAGDGDRAERLLAERVARRPDRYWTTRTTVGRATARG